RTKPKWLMFSKRASTDGEGSTFWFAAQGSRVRQRSKTPNLRNGNGTLRFWGGVIFLHRAKRFASGSGRTSAGRWCSLPAKTPLRRAKTPAPIRRPKPQSSILQGALQKREAHTEFA